MGELVRPLNWPKPRCQHHYTQSNRDCQRPATFKVSNPQKLNGEGGDKRLCKGHIAMFLEETLTDPMSVTWLNVSIINQKDGS